jgi:hypothetical protein
MVKPSLTSIRGDLQNLHPSSFAYIKIFKPVASLATAPAAAS